MKLRFYKEKEFSFFVLWITDKWLISIIPIWPFVGLHKTGTHTHIRGVVKR